MQLSFYNTLNIEFFVAGNLLPPLLTDAQLQVSSHNMGVSVEKYFLKIHALLFSL